MFLRVERPYELSAPTAPAMRGSNSHDSVVEQRLHQLPQPYPGNPHAHLLYHQPSQRNPSVTRAPYPYEPVDYRQQNRRESRKQHQYYPEPHSAYGVIPAPSKTRAPKVPPRDHAVHKQRDRYPQHDDYVLLADRKMLHDAYYAPSAPHVYRGEYDQTLSPLSPSLQRNYGDREDERWERRSVPYCLIDWYRDGKITMKRVFFTGRSEFFPRFLDFILSTQLPERDFMCFRGNSHWLLIHVDHHGCLLF